LCFSYFENNVLKLKGQERPYLGISQRCDLYLAGLFSNPETVKMLNQNGMLHCSCLASTQEEADTRIILHALYSDKLYQENNVQGRIVVKSPDTDVLVLLVLVHYFQNMKNTSELWFQTGLITSTKDCRRYIPVHDCNVIAEKSNNIFTRTNKLFPVRNNPTFNQMQ
jgi:hypothetical protein